MKFIGNTKYIIDEDGNILNSDTGLILRQRLNPNGYFMIGLMQDGIQVSHRVHRLVAEAYLEKPFPDATVNHIDGNKQNNRVDNLEWISLKDNIIHSYELGISKRGEDKTQAILSESDVEIIKLSFVKGASGSELSEQYGVSLTTIYDIRRGITWKHVRPELQWDVSGRTKLTEIDIPLIREAISINMTDGEIGKLFGVHRTTIRHIRLGETWANY
jgi:hypothetical protein